VNSDSEGFDAHPLYNDTTAKDWLDLLLPKLDLSDVSVIYSIRSEATSQKWK
jgi:hypothetical protein